MKLKYYIIIGYLVSTLIVVSTIFWILNKMLIEANEAYLIIGVTIAASLVGFLVSMMLMSKVFYSLEQLNKLIKNVADKNFTQVKDIKSPKEFKQLALSFNEMTLKLDDTFSKLRVSEDEKSMMIAQLSHDIKTPITSIRGMSEGMLDGIIKEEEYNHYLKIIKRQTERLNTLVEELDLITKRTDSNDNINMENIYLDKLLLDVLSQFELKIEQEQRNVELLIPETITKFTSDYNKISRILLNLITNALKYSKPKTTLTIQATIIGKKILIDVIDEGYGIAKEEQQLIFKRLYRVETSRNMETGGYGLGLYIAKELALKLNGDITVDSELGKGSKFTLILPV